MSQLNLFISSLKASSPSPCHSPSRVRVLLQPPCLYLLLFSPGSPSSLHLPFSLSRLGFLQTLLFLFLVVSLNRPKSFRRCRYDIGTTYQPLLFFSKRHVIPRICRPSDERLFPSDTKMHGFSTADGFMEVNEGLTDMIKYLANEPSVGLFFVQQHTQNAVPNLLHIRDKVVENSHKMTLHTEDLEDSISMVGSMRECGFSIADEMNKDIKKSLLIMSTSQPKKGLIRSPVLGFQIGSSSSWSPSALVYGPGQVPSDSGSGYLSTVFNTAKQRAAALRWSPLDASQLRSPKVERQMSSPAPTDSVIATGGAVSTGPVGEADELSLSSQIEHEQLNLSNTASGSSRVHESLTSENFDKFRSDQEARLKQWLEETENHSRHSEAS